MVKYSHSMRWGPGIITFQSSNTKKDCMPSTFPYHTHCCCDQFHANPMLSLWWCVFTLTLGHTAAVGVVLLISVCCEYSCSQTSSPLFGVYLVRMHWLKCQPKPTGNSMYIKQCLYYYTGTIWDAYEHTINSLLPSYSGNYVAMICKHKAE